MEIKASESVRSSESDVTVVNSEAEIEQVVPSTNPIEEAPITKNVTNAVPLRLGRRSVRGSTVRISDAHLPIEENEVDQNSLPKDEFSEQHLQKIWIERVNLLFQGKPGILSSLTKHKPILKEDLTIELKLDGKHQLEQLQENRSVLIEAIRKDLNNFSVQLETPVEEIIVSKKAYTPKEIYQSMVVENPNLEILREQLGLDLDI